MALGLNNIHAYGSRPVLVNQQLKGAYDAGPGADTYAARAGADPEVTPASAIMLASWRAGCGPIPEGFTRLRGSIYCGRMSGAGGPVTGTWARFRVYADSAWYISSLGPHAEDSGIVERTVLDARAYSTLNIALPLVRLVPFVWITVFGWTNGGATQADPKAVLYGIELHATMV